MCFTHQTQSKSVKAVKAVKVSRIQVAPVPMISFTVDETIQCYGCKEVFPLLVKGGGGEMTQGIKINCAGCDNFFHCKVAGTCYGPNCHTVHNGMVHRSAWCTDCVPIHGMNLEKDTRYAQCVCEDCDMSKDPDHNNHNNHNNNQRKKLSIG